MEMNFRPTSNLATSKGTIFQLADGSIQGGNQNVERILGYSIEQLQKIAYFDPPWRTIDRSGADLPPHAHPGISSIRTGRAYSDVVMGFYQPNGNLVWLSVDSQPLFQANNTAPYGVVVSFTDITAIHREIASPDLETTRPIQNRESEQLTLLLIEDNPVDREMYRRYLQKDSETPYIFVEAKSGEEALKIVSARQVDLILLDYLLPDMDGLAWQQQQQQQQQNNLPPVIVLTGQGDENIAVQFIKLGAVDYLVKSQLTSEKLSLAVKRAIAQSQLRTQHQATLSDLQRNQQFTQEITDAIPGVIYFYDAIADKNICTNSQIYNSLGYTPQQIAEMGADFITQVMHPEDLARFSAHLERLERAQQQEVLSFEYRMRHQNGEWRWFCSQDRVYSRSDDGSLKQILGVAQDITKRKETEAELLKTNSILESIISDTSSIIFVKDLEGRYVIANRAAADFLGTDIEQMIGRDDRDLFPPETARSIMTLDRQIIDEAIAWSYEEEIDNGVKKRWLITNKYPWRDGAGNILGVIGLCRDLTALKQSQQKLQDNEKLLSLALRCANAGSWDWEIKTDKVVWSPENYDLYGLDPQKGSPKYQDWENKLHPEDRAKMNQEVQQVLFGQLPKFDSEFRIIHPQKGLRWLWGLGDVTRNDRGEPIRLSGINLDISDRKESEEQLRRSEQHLRRILDSLYTFVGVMSPDGILIEANRAALEVANLKPEDVLAKPFAQTYWWSYDPQIQAQLNDAIQRAATGEAIRYDVNLRISSQKYILIDFNLVPLLDADGKVEYLVPSGIDITKRKQTERALQKSKQQLQKILDSLPVYVGLLNPDGTVVSINQTALDGVGLQLKEVVGKPFAQTYWWSISTELQAKIDDAVKQAAAGEIVRFDTLGKGGREKGQILVEFSIIPVFNEAGEVEYLVPSGIDIGDREASKQALKQREQELKLITEVIPQQVWTALPNGKIDYINRRWQEYTGVSLEEIQDRGWSTIVHPDDLAQMRENWVKAIESGENFDIKSRLRGKNGVYIWFLTRARPLRSDSGEIVKWYGTNTSIHRIKELEDKLQQQTEDLINASRLKDEFLAIVSHELRTPLNPILGWSQLLAAGRLNAEKTTLGIEIIERNAKLQTQLIDDLLDVSRILRGKLNLKQIPLNLESVIRSALTTVQLAANAKRIEIETAFEANIGEVSGDAARLQQIVWNLVSNAIKFTPDGGRVTVTLKQVGVQAQIQVTDTGQGIEPEFLPYVFERFRQAESSSTREFGGLGLGLAIVRHLTELHGGTVAVSSPGLGQGATFSVKLPLMNQPKISQPDDIIFDRSVKPDRFSNLQVLVVDDEPDSLDILTIVLEQEGAKVTPVTSARSAKAALQESTPDLIVSDIGMPEVDGYTLMTQIRELPQGKNIPAIALTAYAGEIDQQRSFDVGFQHHLAKPINIPELINVITQLLG